ncbi:MAG: hypothetical protein E7J21_05535 [Streptococcus salivarius]|nr:hypothetical protein [Streptococcus salivarius]
MFKKLKSLFKKKSTVVELPKTKIEESQLDFPIDRADYFFDHALVFYCEENDITSEKLSKSDMLKISKRAAFHLSVFVAWLAKHDFLNPQSDGFNPEDAQKLKNETITGTDYLFKHLDKKLYSTDISDILRPFISDFYEDYMDSCYTVLVDDVARTEFDWKIYHLVEDDIDEMFSQYKNIK